MTIAMHQQGDAKIAVLHSSDMLLTSVQSALDLMATLSYEHACYKVALFKDNVASDFFDLKTRIAGDILQKFTNYHCQIAIIGDFSQYTSKSLQDFIFECNNGRQVCFAPDEEAALAWLQRD